MRDLWAVGDAYESYVGRWSQPVAADFLDWLEPAPDQRWLDVGCGTGVLTRQVVARCDPHSVLGVDLSEEFVAWAESHTEDPRVRFTVADAAQLPSGVADVVVSGLVLNFLPDALTALASMRAAAPTGAVAAYVWDYAGRMDLMRVFWDAATALDPAAVNFDEGHRFPMCRPAALEDLWRDAGLVDVTSTAIDVPTIFADFDDYWTPFLGGQGPAPGYAASLTDAHRQALRECIQAELATGPDGAIALTARAWAVRGYSLPQPRRM